MVGITGPGKPGSRETRRILIVDDEARILDFFEEVLSPGGIEPHLARRGEDAKALISSGDFDLIVSDLMLGSVDGLDLLNHSREVQPDVPFVVMTGFGSVETAVEAMKRGAFDYITKPFQADHLLVVIEKALRHSDLCREVRSFRSREEREEGFCGITGKSKAMLDLFDLVRRVSDGDSSILLEGESGTGKELFARAIHQNSSRRNRAFVAVNCSVLPENLLESELFGHVKGAFTGAYAEKKGLFEVANGGTLLLDEIGDLNPNMQTKLLRVIQEREIKPVGGTENVPVDVRLLCATNIDLRHAVEERRFRGDLYYRIAVIPIRLPPLRERREDIPLLLNHFLAKFCEKNGRERMQLTPEAMGVLLDHHWRGNVRELEHLMERLVLVSSSPIITVDALPAEFRGGRMTTRKMRVAMEGASSFAASGMEGKTLKERIDSALERVEREAIEEALRSAGGNRSLAAELLGISRGSLYNKMRKYRILETAASGTS